MNSNYKILSTPIRRWPYEKAQALEKQLNVFAGYLEKLGVDKVITDGEKEKIANVDGIESYNMKMAALVWKFLLEKQYSGLNTLNILDEVAKDFPSLHDKTVSFMSAESHTSDKRVIGTNYSIKETRIYCEWIRYVIAFSPSIPLVTLSQIEESNVNPKIYDQDFMSLR